MLTGLEKDGPIIGTGPGGITLDSKKKKNANH
jgi:hypothetical protein